MNSEFPYKKPYQMGGTDGDPEPRTISSSIYPIDSLKKQIQAKRLEAFNETCYGSREHKLQSQAMMNAYDVVLELIDGGK